MEKENKDTYLDINTARKLVEMYDGVTISGFVLEDGEKCDYITVPLVIGNAETVTDSTIGPFDEYYKKHKCCPSCGSKMLRCTIVGMLMDINNPNSYKDTNNALCENCGWSGKIDDLTEEKNNHV